MADPLGVHSVVPMELLVEVPWMAQLADVPLFLTVVRALVYSLASFSQLLFNSDLSTYFKLNLFSAFKFFHKKSVI